MQVVQQGACRLQRPQCLLRAQADRKPLQRHQAVTVGGRHAAVLAQQHHVAPVALPQLQDVRQHLLVLAQFLRQLEALRPRLRHALFQHIQRPLPVLQRALVMQRVNRPADAPPAQPCQQFRPFRFRVKAAYQHVAHLWQRHRAQVKRLAAADDRRQQRLCRPRQQNQNRGQRRFFQRLQQRVLRAGLRPVEVAEDRNPVTRLERLQRQAAHHVTNRLNPQRAGVLVRLGVQHVRVISTADQLARTARPTRAQRLVRRGTVQRHRKGVRQRVLAYRLRARHQVSMAHPPVSDALAKLVHGPVVTVNRPAMRDLLVNHDVLAASVLLICSICPSPCAL